VGRGIGGHSGDRRRNERFFHDSDDVARRKAKVDAEGHHHAVRHRLTAAPPEHLQRLRQKLPVGDDEQVPVACLDDRVPPADLFDLSLDLVFELDPVALAERVVGAKGEPAHHVAERRLQRKTDDRRYHRRRGDDAGHVDARPVEQPSEGDHICRGHREIVQNVRIFPAERVQDQIEERQREHVDDQQHLEKLDGHREPAADRLGGRRPGGREERDENDGIKDEQNDDAAQPSPWGGGHQAKQRGQNDHGRKQRQKQPERAEVHGYERSTLRAMTVRWISLVPS
jgi:hypothetical protein